MTHSDLVEEHFDIKYQEYDLLIRKLIPRYNELHELVVQLVPYTKDDIFSVLELGVGTGSNALSLLNYFSFATFYGIDISASMLNQAKIRLKKYRNRIVLHKVDMSRLNFDTLNEYEVCFGVLSIHHLDDQQKQDLFNKVYNKLKPGGIFIIADIVNFPTKEETEEKENEWIQYLESKMSVDEAKYRFENYLEEDMPSPLSFQLRWLKKSGFSIVKEKLSLGTMQYFMQ